MKPIRDPNFLRSLAQLLEEECLLHGEYIKLLESEQKAITQFRPDEVTLLSEKRGVLTEKISLVHDRRVEFMKRFPDAEHKKLSELIVSYCHPDDAKKLSPVVKKLKGLIARSRQLGEELGQIAQFSLSMVNGTMSLLWSATQNVTRGYGRSGKVKENYQALKNDVLKSA